MAFCWKVLCVPMRSTVPIILINRLDCASRWRRWLKWRERMNGEVGRQLWSSHSISVPFWAEQCSLCRISPESNPQTNHQKTWSPLGDNGQDAPKVAKSQKIEWGPSRSEETKMAWRLSPMWIHSRKSAKFEQGLYIITMLISWVWT
jgi:hypothetical protein